MELKEFFKMHYHLSEEIVSMLFTYMNKVTFTKGEMIQNEGKTDYYIYFVESGIVRSFIRKDGKDITLSIVSEGCSPLSSVRLVQPSLSKVSINALTDCILWRMTRTQLGQLCKESLVFANFARELVENMMAETEVYWTDYYPLDKKSQYKLFMRQQPDLFQRIPLNEIASYLGITPQSLSRIRADID